VTIATIPSQTPGGPTGGNNFTDTGLAPGLCYNYQVAASNASGMSTWNINGPVQMCTSSAPGAPTGLAATAVSPTQVDLTWTAGTGVVNGYHVERSEDGGVTWTRLGSSAVTSYSDLTALPQTTYLYHVIAFNATTESLPSTPVTVTTPYVPAMPLDLGASALGSDPYNVTLTWLDDADNEDGFVVLRCTGADCANFGPVGTAPESTGVGGTVTFVDPGRVGNTSYSYQVFATNQWGDSPVSNIASLVTPAWPAAPTNLRRTLLQPTRVVLAWNDNSNNETGFRVERCEGAVCTNFAQIAQVGANVVAYNDTTVLSGTPYRYRVYAFNATAISGFSNVLSVTTTGPRAPSNLRVTAFTRTSISLAWNDNSTNETGFQIQRSTNGTTWTTIATRPAGSTTYTNTGLTPNTLYYYRVRAINGGQSNWSNVVQQRTNP
jgi:hypothetical protein